MGKGLCLIPAPLPGEGLKGVLTGVLRLACVSWETVDNKARTKPLYSQNFLGFILAFSALYFKVKL